MNYSSIFLVVFVSFCLYVETRSLEIIYLGEAYERDGNIARANAESESEAEDPLHSLERQRDAAAGRLQQLIHEMNAEKKEETVAVVEMPPPVIKPDVVYVDHHTDCWIPAGIIQKIDYSRQPTFMSVPQAFLQCKLCLAIADKLNHTLNEAQQSSDWLPLSEDPFILTGGESGGSRWLNILHTDYVTAVLRATCCSSFQDYGLREHKGVISVTEAYSYTDYVPAIYDGRWQNILSQECHVYLDVYEPKQLYLDWLLGHEDVRNMLCRNEEKFRDCIGL